MPLVSVIMPAHNAEKHIRGTLDCILGQTYTHWELLCVENGSTDGTRAILDEYAARDSRIRVMVQDPPGAGLARNAGIQAACGKYLCFVDADDTYYPNMLEALATAAEKHSADLVLAAVETTTDPEDRPEKRQCFDPILKQSIRKRIREQGLCLREELQENVLLISSGAAWGKLYLTSFVKHNGIRFLTCRYSEDLFFTFHALILSERAAIVDAPLLCYRIWSDSLSHKEESDYEVQISVYRDLFSSLQQLGLPPYVITSARKRFTLDLWWFLHILSPEAKFSLRERYMRVIEPDFQIFADQHLPALREISQWNALHRFMMPKVRFLVHPPEVAGQLKAWWRSLRAQVCLWYEVVCLITGEEPPATMDFLHKKAMGCDWFFVSANYWQTPHAGSFRVIHIKQRGKTLHPLASIRAIRGEPAARLVRHGAVCSILSPWENLARLARFTLFNHAPYSIVYNKLDNSATYRIAGVAIKKYHLDIPKQFAETTEIEEY